jgi:hypothetical protein
VRSDEIIQREGSMRSSYKPSSIGLRAAILLIALASSAAFLAVVEASSQADRRPTAHAARTLSGADTAHLHLVHQYESIIYEEGPAKGSFPGQLHAQLNIGPTFTGHVTFYTRAGSIIGNGSATPHGAGRYQSFGGSLTVTGGTGRYRHIHGHGGLYGTFDRRTFALVVQTTGNYEY